MRFVVAGSQQFITRCVAGIEDAGCEVVGFISIPEELRPNNSIDTRSFAAERFIKYHEVEDINSEESHGIIRGYEPDYLLISWPRLLKQDSIDIAKYCSIGTHTADLPYNRGCHPIHWAIVLGIPEIQLSFFRLDPGVDTGDVLLKVPVPITPNHTVIDLMSTISQAGYDGTKQLCKLLMEEPAYSGIAQDHSRANYWRKRTPHDVTLDSRMSASFIQRTVRSFSPPYPCANLIFEDSVLKITEVVVSKMNAALSEEELLRMEPGKILAVDGAVIRIKAEDAIIDITCAGTIPERLARAKHIHPPTKYLADWPELLPAG